MQALHTGCGEVSAGSPHWACVCVCRLSTLGVCVCVQALYTGGGEVCAGSLHWGCGGVCTMLYVCI